jgi:hypothetical protein
MEDDGLDRGGVFLFMGAHIKRQFEFSHNLLWYGVVNIASCLA